MCLSDMFNFIIRFGESLTLPVNVSPMVQAFVHNAILFIIPDILDNNTFMIIYGYI
jgi:hypothetical protein